MAPKGRSPAPPAAGADTRTYRAAYGQPIIFKNALCWFSIPTDGDSVILCYVLYISIETMTRLQTSSGDFFLVF